MPEYKMLQNTTPTGLKFVDDIATSNTPAVTEMVFS